MLGNLTNIANKMQAKGEGLLAAGMKNIKMILPTNKNLPVCELLEGMMQTQSAPGGGGAAAPGDADKFLYLDPKSAQIGVEAPRIRTPMRHAIVFVVGGGNYVEQQCLQEWAQKSGKQVTYGSTDFVSPVTFTEELGALGRAH